MLMRNVGWLLVLLPVFLSGITASGAWAGGDRLDAHDLPDVFLEGRRLPPPAPGYPIDSETKAFAEHLLERVRADDVSYIRSLIRPETTLSFGGDAGLQGFDDLYGDRPAELLEILEGVLGAGGRFYAPGSEPFEYCAPYTFTDFPRDLDPYDYLVVAGERVPLIDFEGEKSRRKTYLSHHLVKLIRDHGPRGHWFVEVVPGLEGYVDKRSLLSPLNHRACFARDESGGWFMLHLVAGD